MDRAMALRVLARAPVVRLATAAEDGRPILKTVHGVIVDDAIAFHGAPAGEKMDGMGRECVIAAEEIVAQIPSYFVDPERACPATTYYLSVQLHGTLEPVDDAAAKARVLAALMTRFQPEGGHIPIDAAHPLYRKAIEGLLVARVSLEKLDGKAKLGQNRTPQEIERVLELLWRRGAPGDARAIDLVRAAHPNVTPAFLAGPAHLSCAPEPETAEEVAELLKDAYWNGGVSRDALVRSHLNSSAWVAARNDEGRLVGSARALSDGAKYAWIYDVIIAPGWRGRGLGQSLMRLLLDHPAVRGARTVLLGTRDAQNFYACFGFRERPVSKFTSMALER
jgi:nitroimidazol reductase NimA-like FMN-containing flavoprotein (pyridoxamine 5'-phosphate oxidase superfamily)/ribosomal protein S18 acetylase RimI-like enzyme